MSDFRGPLPLDDRDFAEVRRSVLSKIGRRPLAIPLALAAAVILAVIVIVLPRPKVPPPPVPHHVAPALSRREPHESRPQVVVAKPAPVENRRHVPQQLVAPSGAPPPDSEITMNIETADPNVRIIWISR
jgi:hypothetical protein